MAIINCPECGEKISSHATKCIHCGCKITYCKECGKAFVGEPEICDECGFIFKKENEEKSDIKSDKTISQLCTEFKSESLINNLLSYAILPYIVAAIALIIWGIAAYKIFSYGGNINSVNNPNDSLADLDKKIEMLANFKNDVNEIKILTILGIIMFAIFIPFNDLREICYCQKFAKWCRLNKIDLTEKIKQSLTIDTTCLSTEQKFQVSDCVMLGAESQVYYTDSTLKNECLKRTIFKMILVLVGLIFIGIFVIDNSQAYMMHQINKTDNSDRFSLDMLENTIFPNIGIAIFIINFLVNHSFFKDIREEKPKQWVKANLPEYFERYIECTNLDGIFDKTTL